MTTVIKKTIPVQVTAKNGDKVTYTLTIYKEDALTQLENITVDGKEATKIGNTSYKATIPADADSSTIIATTLYNKARVEINELGEEVQVTTKVVATTQEQICILQRCWVPCHHLALSLHWQLRAIQQLQPLPSSKTHVKVL